MKSWLLLALLPVVIAGCSAQQIEYRSASEIPAGPGMFSGDNGEFTLSPEKRKDTPVTPADYREFEEFREFMRWKKTAADGPEYREFQEWREWKKYRTQQTR